MPTQTLAPEILTAALHGLEVQRQRIDSQIAEVRRMLRQQPASAVTATAPETGPQGSAQPRRKMSAAARKRIAEAQKKRWAAFHGESSAQKGPKAAEAPARKRKMSAAGRARIAEAARKRWAEFRKTSAKAKPVQNAKTAKKSARKKRTTKKAGAKRPTGVERGAETEAATV